ncbi:MAG: hypothetical protein LZF62_230063 [Nitrospira sp.]|nr:MAG: hypothetical protein LZF62_230063 [Nitrospira sp.]
MSGESVRKDQSAGILRSRQWEVGVDQWDIQWEERGDGHSAERCDFGGTRRDSTGLSSRHGHETETA